MALREGLVDHMTNPVPVRAASLLLQPVNTVAVTLAINDVHFAVVVNVIPDDRKSRIAQVPIRMPFPLVVIRVDIFKPSVGSEDIGLSVAVDIGNADAVTILHLAVGRNGMNNPVWIGDAFIVAGVAAEAVDDRLGAGEIHPENPRMVVVGERQIRLAISVDIRHPAAFGVIACLLYTSP